MLPGVLRGKRVALQVSGGRGGWDTVTITCPHGGQGAPPAAPQDTACGAVPGMLAQVRTLQVQVEVCVSCQGSLPREGRKCVCALYTWLEVALGGSHMLMAFLGCIMRLLWPLLCLERGALVSVLGCGEVLPAAHALRVEDNWI